MSDCAVIVIVRNFGCDVAESVWTNMIIIVLLLFGVSFPPVPPLLGLRYK